MRTNSNKNRILQLLQDEHLLSLEAMQAQVPDADFSTIYRNIQQLVAEGVVKKVILDSKVVVYELSDHHHDHFVCDLCQRVEVVNVPTTTLGKRLVRDVVVRGECEKCLNE